MESVVWYNIGTTEKHNPENPLPLHPEGFFTIQRRKPQMEITLNTTLQTQDIDWNFLELREELKNRLKKYQGLIYTEEAISEAKAERAALNKLKAALEDKRKEVKKAFAKPYDDFEKKVKELTALVDEPIKAINSQVAVFETKQKEQKKQLLEAYYNKIIGGHERVLWFEKVLDETWLNVSTSLSKAMRELLAKVEAAKRDIESIYGLNSEFEISIMKVYVNTLSLSEALREKEALEAQKKKMEALREKEELETQNKKAEAPQAEAKPENKLIDKLESPNIELKKPDEPQMFTQSKSKIFDPKLAGSYYPYSISKIKTFECPRKFFFRYIKKLPEEKGAAADRGLKIHDAIAKALEGKKYDKEFEQDVNVALNYVGDKIVNQVENRFAILPDFTPTEFFDNNGFFRGIIDCVAEKEIIDWKSGFGQAEFDQIQVYGYILERLGSMPEVLTLYYLRKRKADSILYKSKEGKEAFEKMRGQIKIIESYKEEKQFNPNPSPRCSYCGYKRICQANELGYPEIFDSETLLMALEQVEMEKVRIKSVEEAAKNFVLETGITCINQQGQEYKPNESTMLRIIDKDRFAIYLNAMGIDPASLIVTEYDTEKVKKILEAQPDKIDGVYKKSAIVRVGWTKKGEGM